MKTRTPLRILLATVMTLALLPMLSSLAPGSLLSASPAAADQLWYQSAGDTRAKKKACARGGGAAGTCVIGARGPGGGKVFYVNNAAATGSRYMEAAPSGWNTGADPNLTWGEHTGGTDCSIVNVRGAAGTAIGTGRANTRKITAACTAAWAPAAWAAKNYTGGGVSWFLPSKDELNQLWLERAVGGFSEASYWSSSQYDAGGAWAQSFVSGNQFVDVKFFTVRVRPVRAF